MIEDGCAGAPIPLPNVDTKTLVKVVEYWKKHVEMGKLAGDSNGDEDRKCVADALKTWDAEFVNVDRATLYDLVLVINKLFFFVLLLFFLLHLALVLVCKGSLDFYEGVVYLFIVQWRLIN